MGNNAMDLRMSQYDDWQLGLVVYSTIDELIMETKRLISDENDCDLESIAIDSEGRESVVTELEMIDGIKETGLYGFVEEQDARDVVHIWADLEKVSFSNLLFFFGHEAGHVVPEPELPIGDPLRDEQEADGYAFAAIEAYRLATIVWESRFQGGNRG